MRWCDDWLLLPERIALHEPSATAVIADVHLGYSAVRQRLGDAVPTRTVEEELHPLTLAVKHHAIRQLLVAGDLFERGYDRATAEQFLEEVDRLDLRFLGLVPGNHDRGSDQATERMALFPRGYDLAGWHVCHGDQPVECVQAVSGHWHPALRVRGRKLPCFLTRGKHLILPAFSLDAAGVDIGRDARWRDWQRHAVRPDGVAEGSSVNHR